MADPASANALRRKTSVGQRAREVRGLTPTRAIRIALARAAGDLWELPLSALSVDHDVVNVERLSGFFDEQDLFLLLDGPDGVRGGMAVDRALLTSVTEVQTIGSVSERPPGERAYTPTDAALFAPLADAMLERVDLALNGPESEVAACHRREAAWALGYRFGAKVDRLRSLLLALEGEEFHILRAEVHIAAGMRRGRIMLCLPDAAVDEQDPDAEPCHEPGAHAEALSTVPTRLSATLPRFRLPLARATRLQVGDVLPMTPDALGNVLLRASDGRCVARCALGKIGDLRALRVEPRSGEGGAARSETAEAASGFSAGLPARGTTGPGEARALRDLQETGAAPSSGPKAAEKAVSTAGADSAPVTAGSGHRHSQPTASAASAQSEAQTDNQAEGQRSSARSPADHGGDLPPLDFEADDRRRAQHVGNASFE